MEIIADLHLHSRFSRAVSPKMNLSTMYEYGKRKGINLLSVPDFTHPVWFKEVQAGLAEAGKGIYTLEGTQEIDNREFSSDLYKDVWGPFFIFATELATIYSDKGKVRRIHSLVLAPNIEAAEKINKTLSSRGFNLGSDGRPILGISTRDLYELLLSIDENIILIPCHVWTPHFGIYGSKSGYDSIEECFEEYSKYIYTVETGLSSDPAMNWRVEEIKNRSIVSFSDAHSLEKMGREATVFALNKDGISNDKFQISNFQLNYKDIVSAFKQDSNGKLEIAYTIEFYPEEGKYHFTGHRKCQVSFSPEDVKKKGVMCPVCMKTLTVGVMDRVEDLAKEGPDNIVSERDDFEVTWIKDRQNTRPPYVSLVQLLGILSSALSSGATSSTVTTIYSALTKKLGSEFDILLKTKIEDIEQVAGIKVAEAIRKVRQRDLNIVPGFDGEFGKVEISFDKNKKTIKSKKEQLGLEF